MSEFEKRGNNRDRLLKLLSDGQAHHMTEMQRHAGFRYGARLKELRDQGYQVETIRVGVDEFAYKLVMQGQGVLL